MPLPPARVLLGITGMVLAGMASTDMAAGVLILAALAGGMIAVATLARYRGNRFHDLRVRGRFGLRGSSTSGGPESRKLQHTVENDAAPTAGVDPSKLILTPRELEVLRLVAAGAHDKEIARKLCIEETTVRYHLRSAFHKLGAKSRAHAVWLVCRRGWLD